MAINVFTFSGNLGSDMEVRYTPSGKAIGEVSAACKSGYGDHEKTSWIRCKLFGDRAEKLAPYLTKGCAVTVTGEFVEDQWEKDGVKHSRPTVLIRDIQLPPKSQQSAVQHFQAPPMPAEEPTDIPF